MTYIVSEGIQEVSKMEMVVVVEGEAVVSVEMSLAILSPEEQTTPHRVVVESVSPWESV